MKKGKEYLLRTPSVGIEKCKCLEVTEKCYKIAWENGREVWIEKSDFNTDTILPFLQRYTILEELANIFY